MNRLENAVMVVVILLAPVGLIYGWFFALSRMETESPSWRNRISIAALSLISLVAFLWPFMRALAPRVDWSTGGGEHDLALWIASWNKLALRMLLAALVLGLMGRPRLIIPILFASVGMAFFWVMSYVP